MFVFTAKLTKARAIAIVLILALILTAIILLAGSKNRNRTEVANGSIRSNEDRVAYLMSFGWEVDPDPIETQEIIIPKAFSETYKDYNELQLKQGFDLSDYGGETATRYTYEILNYPTGEKNVVADIIVRSDTVIAGDVQSPDLDGFMHGLTKE